MDSTTVVPVGQEVVTIINAVVTAVILILGFLNRHNIFKKKG